MYVVVLGTSMSVMIIGLAALTAIRIERRAVGGTSDFAKARLYARSAVEMAFFSMSDDPDWRTNRPHGAWFTDLPIGEGTYTVEVVDPGDQDFTNDPLDLIVITGTGICGNPLDELEARYKLEVSLRAENGGWVIVDGSWRRVVD